MIHIKNDILQQKTILVLIISLLTASCLFATSSHGKEKMKMQQKIPHYLYRENEVLASNKLKPQVFKCSQGLFSANSDICNVTLFPVPFNNAVGTDDISNAITILSFQKDKVRQDKYFKNAVDDLAGGGQYMPVISSTMIGLGQTRSFVLYDFKKRIHHEYEVTTSIAKTIEKIAVADADRQRFIFEIERGSSDPWKSTDTLALIEFNGGKKKVVKEIKMPVGSVWTTTHDRVFLWEFDNKKLHVFDMNLEPAHHALEELIKKHNNKTSFIPMYIHPYLPFAIFDGGMGTFMISWGGNKDKEPHFVIESGQDYSFSPDGKWVAFKHGVDSDDYKTFVMPVSDKYPNYLGYPILLSDDYFLDKKVAWTTNPTALVGTDSDGMYRWDLVNRDFPEKGKMSFHDYIVKKDLEKLTREKRQGLEK